MLRKRRQPVSSLRARLEERVSEHYDHRDYPGTEEKPRRSSFTGGLIGRMHSCLKVKVTVAVAVVFLTGLLVTRGPAWTRPAVEGLRNLIAWHIDPGELIDQAVPAFKTAWESGNLPRLGADYSTPVTGKTPVEGTLCSGYGLRRQPSGDGEQMHYGVDLVAPGGSPVRAVLAGQVVETDVTGEAGAILLEHQDGWQTFYRGLAIVETVAGESVQAGQTLGFLGEGAPGEQPRLHFELRYRGRPVEPPADWIELFSGG